MSTSVTSFTDQVSFLVKTHIMTNKCYLTITYDLAYADDEPPVFDLESRGLLLPPHAGNEGSDIEKDNGLDQLNIKI